MIDMLSCQYHLYAWFLQRFNSQKYPFGFDKPFVYATDDAWIPVSADEYGDGVWCMQRDAEQKCGEAEKGCMPTNEGEGTLH